LKSNIFYLFDLLSTNKDEIPIKSLILDLKKGVTSAILICLCVRDSSGNPFCAGVRHKKLLHYTFINYRSSV